MAGVAQLRIHEGNRLISVDKENTEEKDRPIHLGGGRYSVEGNSLKLIFIEKDKKAFLTYFMGQTGEVRPQSETSQGQVYCMVGEAAFSARHCCSNSAGVR